MNRAQINFRGSFLIGKDFLQSDYLRLPFNIKTDWAKPFQSHENQLV